MKVVRFVNLSTFALAIMLVAAHSTGLFDRINASVQMKSSETGRKQDSLSEIIANRLDNGDLTCPTGDQLTYEACLLYQGGLEFGRKLDSWISVQHCMMPIRLQQMHRKIHG